MYWFIGILGILLLNIPFVFGYMTNPMATWSSIIPGVIVILLAGYQLFTQHQQTPAK